MKQIPILLLVVACGSTTTSENSETTAGDDTPVVQSETYLEGSPAPPRELSAEVESDVRTIIGGMFSPDHLGPDVYSEILSRAHADSATYVVALIEVVGDSPDAMWLSSIYAAHLLELLREYTPVAHAAERLLALHRASTRPQSADESWNARMNTRIRRLERLRAP